MIDPGQAFVKTKYYLDLDFAYAKGSYVIPDEAKEYYSETVWNKWL